jgi:hypothetical protein
MAAANDNGDDDGDDGAPASEQDVVVHLRLGNRSLGTAAERAGLGLLAEQLATAVEDAGAGEYDGDEYGGGECLLFFAGPDAEALYAVLQPLLRAHPLGRGATVQLQSGGGEPVTRRP